MRIVGGPSFICYWDAMLLSSGSLLQPDRAVRPQYWCYTHEPDSHEGLPWRRLGARKRQDFREVPWQDWIWRSGHYQPSLYQGTESAIVFHTEHVNPSTNNHRRILFFLLMFTNLIREVQSNEPIFSIVFFLLFAGVTCSVPGKRFVETQMRLRNKPNTQNMCRLCCWQTICPAVECLGHCLLGILMVFTNCQFQLHCGQT